MATPDTPRRIAWVLESTTRTATSFPKRFQISSRILFALASGFFGRRVTIPSGAFDSSIPAFGRKRFPRLARRYPGTPPTISSDS